MDTTQRSHLLLIGAFLIAALIGYYIGSNQQTNVGAIPSGELVHPVAEESFQPTTQSVRMGARADILRTNNGATSPAINTSQACNSNMDAVDYDASGTIDAKDIAYLERIIQAQTCFPGKICDINGDGAMTAKDLASLRGYVDLQVKLEVCGDGVDNDCNGGTDIPCPR